MTFGRAQEHEVENDKHAYDHCSEQEPLLFRHGILFDVVIPLRMPEQFQCRSLFAHSVETAKGMSLSATGEKIAL
jgi:hypothetical protein